MANQRLLDILIQGVSTWNMFRKRHTGLHFPDLTGAKLNRVKLSGANLVAANLCRADLTEADLSGADLSFALLSGADLSGADLSGADLSGATFDTANLSWANLSRADLFMARLNDAYLFRANLSGARLGLAALIRTNLTEAILTDCLVYGVSVWDVKLDGARQNDLVITYGKQPTITVDNLKVAQFIYLLLNNEEIREVIDTIGKKAVLILGRFTPERKRVLDALREALRQHNYLPILFDFEKPASRDITETISTLAHLARFVIADITDAKSIPQELMTIVPNLPSVPVLPLILNSQHEYGMFEHFTRFSWVLPVYRYTDEVSLLQSLQKKVIVPAEQKAMKIQGGYG